MDWLHTLLSWWASFSNLCAQWKYNSEKWVWPLNIIAPFFRALSSIADGLFSGFFDFVYWADRVNRDIREMLTKSWVIDYLSNPLSQLNKLWSWFLDRASYITAITTTWWQGISTTILGWVEMAKTYALGLVNNLQGVVNTLSSNWNVFTGTVLPTLASRFDVDTLIKSAFKPWTDLFNFWGQVGSEVKMFFLNPVDYIWQRFTDWFFGGE